MDALSWPRVRLFRLSATEGAQFRSHSAITCISFRLWGLGLSRRGARRVTDAMMLAAARALAGNSPALKDSAASLLPSLTDIRRVAAQIAIAVGMEAQKDGLAPRLAEEELRQRVIAAQWTPAYPSFVGSWR